MALPIGVLLFILGVVAFKAWWPVTFWFLQGVVAFSLLLWGGLAILIGISERKAQSDFNAAVRDGDAAPAGRENRSVPESTENETVVKSAGESS